MMISKSAAVEFITDYCLLIEKQTEGFSKEQLIETVKFLYENKNDSSKNHKDTPSLELGEDMKSIYLKLPGGSLEKVTTENFRVCVNYVELIESRKNEEIS